MWKRSCMKTNGKSPTFKFVPGEERRLSEVQRVSWSWRLPGAMPMSADLTWIRKWLEKTIFFANATTERRKTRLNRSRRPVKTGPGLAGVVTRPIWDPTLSSGRVGPPSDFVLDSSGLSLSQTKENWQERLLPRPSTPQTLTHMWNSLSSELPHLVKFQSATNASRKSHVNGDKPSALETGWVIKSLQADFSSCQDWAEVYGARAVRACVLFLSIKIAGAPFLPVILKCNNLRKRLYFIWPNLNLSKRECIHSCKKLFFCFSCQPLRLPRYAEVRPSLRRKVLGPLVQSDIYPFSVKEE